MGSLALPKEAIALLDQLDLLGLDALIKKLENDLHEDDVRLTSLKKRIDELRTLREALAQKDQQSIAKIREKLGLPPTTS